MPRTPPATAPSSEPTPAVRLFRQLIVVGQRLRVKMDERLTEVGLTTQQLSVLTLVGDLGSPSLSDISRALGFSHQNARQIVDALSRKGFVETATDPDDRRVLRVRQTGAHLPLFAQRDHDDFDAVRSWFSELDDDEIDTLLALLRKVRATL